MYKLKTFPSQLWVAKVNLPLNTRRTLEKQNQRTTGSPCIMRFLGPQKIPAIQVLIAVIFDLKSAYSRTIDMLLKGLGLFRKPRYSRQRRWNPLKCGCAGYWIHPNFWGQNLVVAKWRSKKVGVQLHTRFHRPCKESLYSLHSDVPSKCNKAIFWKTLFLNSRKCATKIKVEKGQRIVQLLYPRHY